MGYWFLLLCFATPTGEECKKLPAISEYDCVVAEDGVRRAIEFYGIDARASCISTKQLI
jgi:hypothetical protein